LAYLSARDFLLMATLRICVPAPRPADAAPIRASIWPRCRHEL